jgi:hypothetical protein
MADHAEEAGPMKTDNRLKVNVGAPKDMSIQCKIFSSSFMIDEN